MNVKKITNPFRITLLILGVVITFNAFVASFYSNINAGIVLIYVLGLGFLLCGAFFDIFSKLPSVVKILFLVMLVLVTAFVMFLYIYGLNDNASYREDAVIVLGAGIHGERLSGTLKSRLDCALSYHAENPDALIVVSGGQGPQEDITEALAMERYLLEQGVPKDKIIKEEKATSTAENFKFSKELLDNHFESEYSIAFITNDYHIYRAESNAYKTGFEKTTHLHNTTSWYSVIASGLRETLAVLKLWIWDR